MTVRKQESQSVSEAAHRQKSKKRELWGWGVRGSEVRFLAWSSALGCVGNRDCVEERGVGAERSKGLVCLEHLCT